MIARLLIWFLLLLPLQAMGSVTIFFNQMGGEPPTISVTAPNGAEHVFPGMTLTVTWTSDNLNENVNISLSADGGTTWTTIVANTADDGTQAWTVAGAASSSYKIRVSGVTQTTVLDVSDAVFRIGGIHLK